MSAPGGTWTSIGPARELDMKRLHVADFDGDGIADVGRFVASGANDARFQISKSGAAAFQDKAVVSNVITPARPVFGRFDAVAGVDLVAWSGGDREWRLSSGTAGAWQTWSRQDMR